MRSSGAVRPVRDDLPESWYAIAAGVLLGSVLLLAFGTHVVELEQTPPELLFGFLGLYFYAAGYLSARRTGKLGTGTWAGLACGLAFGIVVCITMYTSNNPGGLRDAIRSGDGDRVAIAWSGAVFFMMLGAGCGRLGARLAIQSYRPRR